MALVFASMRPNKFCLLSLYEFPGEHDFFLVYLVESNFFVDSTYISIFKSYLIFDLLESFQMRNVT